MGLAVRSLVVVTAALSLSACGAVNSIHYAWPGPKGSTVISVDAKQRHLIMAPYKNGTEEGMRTCSEAAPDVFSAFSSSFSGNGLLGPTQNDVEAAAAVAEAAATVERTQTINMLREVMFRTCERWLNGALTKEQFIVQAARDQQTMLAILAIEQLTGTTKGKSTIISGPSTSAAIADGEVVAKLITDFNKDYQAAKSAQATSKTTLDGLNQKAKCVSEEAKPDGVSDEDWAACNSAKADKSAKDTELTETKSRLDNAISAANKLGSGMSAGTTAIAAQTDAAGRPDGPTIAVVAKAVENIATRPAIDEVLMFCIAYLSNPDRAFDASDTTRGTCNSALAGAAAQELQYRQQILGDEEAGAGNRLMGRTEPAYQRSLDRFNQLVAKVMTASDDNAAQAGMAHMRTTLGIPANALNSCASKTACTALLQENSAAFRDILRDIDAATFDDAISKF